MSAPYYPQGDPYIAPGAGNVPGNILAQGLSAIIQRQERNRGLQAMAQQFETLGPEGAQIANVMRTDPNAAAKMFDMYGGGDKLFQFLHTKNASRALAESMGTMRQLQTVEGPEGASEREIFNYTGFNQRALELGLPLGQISAATNAIAQGEAVNLPDIGQTEDWTEQNGQPMRRRVWFDKNTGQIISAGDWSPAFRPGGGKVTRIRPDGTVEIFEDLTANQQMGEVKEGLKTVKASASGAELLGILDQFPGVSGMGGSMGEAISGGASQAARVLNNLMGEEVFNPEGTEESVADAIMDAPPEVRSRYKTIAHQWATGVRKTMDLGKPSNADLAIANDAAAALSSWRSPTAIKAAIEQLMVMGEKYTYLNDVAISKKPETDWLDLRAVNDWVTRMRRAGLSKERAIYLADQIYNSIHAGEM